MVFDSDGVALIAVKPINLLHDQDTARAVPLKVFHHFPEIPPAWVSGGLFVNKLFDDPEAEFRCVFAKQTNLGFYSISITLFPR